MLRVAVELVTCYRCKHVIYWKDYWFSLDDERETFRGMVQEKLRGVLASLGSLGSRGDSEKEARELQRREEKLRAELAQARAALLEAQAKADKAARQMELELQAMRERAEEAESHSAALEASKGRKDDVARQLQEALAKLKAAEAALEAQAAEGSTSSGQLRQRILELETQLKEAKARAGEAEAQVPPLQAEVKRLQEVLSQNEAALKSAPKEVIKEVKTSTATSESSELKSARALNAKLQERLEALQREVAELESCRARIKDLEASEASSREDAEALRRELEKLRGQLAEAQNAKDGLLQEAANKTVETAPVSQVASSEGGDAASAVKAELQLVSKRLKDKEQEVEELRSQLGKLKQTSERQAKTIEGLKEDKERLEEEKLKTLKTLNMLRKQIKELMALAESKGLKSEVDKLMSESGLGSTYANADWSCFERLYQDALRRQNKLREREEARVKKWDGQTPDSSPRLAESDGYASLPTRRPSFPRLGLDSSRHPHQQFQAAIKSNWGPAGAQFLHPGPPMSLSAVSTMSAATSTNWKGRPTAYDTSSSYASTQRQMSQTSGWNSQWTSQGELVSLPRLAARGTGHTASAPQLTGLPVVDSHRTKRSWHQQVTSDGRGLQGCNVIGRAIHAF
eukprot:TRINITY_DN7414_c0_g2_i2.p1 TRINITY_DN7414_c0_g2~~TRINITY_DN7414_c0_g2_i2.p1  ORF type:complete len:652 (-),score=194.07 TRINITY_DN7414_c0_g2_i2:48-1943(-)